MPGLRPLPSPPFASHDTYATPEGRQRPCARILPPSLYFYSRMIATVIHSGRIAKRGSYDNTMWTRSSVTILHELEETGCRLDVRGMRHLTSFDGPAVIIANHMSVLETFILPVLISTVKRCTFVIKPSLMEYPVFGPVMRAVHPIVVSRDNPRKDLQIVLEEGQARLAAGMSIILFPQTTRTTEFQPAQFNTLGVKLARNCGVPAIPLALRTDAWGNGRRLKDFGRIDPSRRIHFTFGAPMRVEGNEKEVHAAIVQFIGDHLRTWSVEHQRPVDPDQ